MKGQIDGQAQGDLRRNARVQSAKRRRWHLALAFVAVASLTATAWLTFWPTRYLPRPAYILIYEGNNSVRVEPWDADFRRLWIQLDARFHTPVAFAALAVEQKDIHQLKAEQIAVEFCYDRDIALEFSWKQSGERREGIRYLLAPLTGERVDLLFFAGGDGVYRDGPIGLMKLPQDMLDAAARALERRYVVPNTQ